MEQKKNADNEEKIVQLHEMLKKKDEELEGLTKQQLASLDVDMDDVDEPATSSTGGKGSEKKNEGEKDAEESKNRKSTKRPKKAIVQSIESSDGVEDSEDNGLGLGVSRDDLDCINPDIVQNWRNSPTYVLIAWDIDGKINKTWETRACLRDRWGKKDADIAIYEAAVEAEGRYMEAKTGKRLAKSRSPSVGLAQGHVRKHREKSLGIKRSSPFRSTPTTRASKSPQPETKTWEELREEFLNDYLELLGAEDFADLSRSEKRECIAAWREEKSLHPAGAAT
ncbi:hypothetical protein B0T10DRAFT_465825 [Thelonectria olida]|uniref:Uncharacterized protein n=1 Tax=Thelonectria olida TaxID=1576542 RepID=A0A9P8VR55_9HYPO|nr:hypothetical protein B0T10DRAFT_465825 [Thelonectria olida]